MGRRVRSLIVGEQEIFRIRSRMGLCTQMGRYSTTMECDGR